MSEAPREPIDPDAAQPAQSSPATPTDQRQPERRRGRSFLLLPAVIGLAVLAAASIAGAWFYWTSTVETTASQKPDGPADEEIQRPDDSVEARKDEEPEKPAPAGRTPRYEARGFFFCCPERIRLDPEVKARQARESLLAFRQVQATLLRSRKVLNATLEKRWVAELESVKKQADPVEWLENNLSVEFPHEGEVLEVRLRGDSPEDLVVLLKAVMNTYLDEVVPAKHNNRLAEIEQLGYIAQRCADRLTTKLRLLQQLPRTGSSTSSELASQQTLAKEQERNALRELVEVQDARRKKQLELSVLDEREKGLAGMPILDCLTEEAIAGDPVIRGLTTEQGKLQDGIEPIRRQTTEANFPAASEKARMRLETIRKALVTRQTKVRPIIERQLRQELLEELKESRRDLMLWLDLSRQLEETLIEVHRISRLLQKPKYDLRDLEYIMEQLAQVDVLLKDLENATYIAASPKPLRQLPPPVQRLEDDIFLIPLK